MDIQFSTLIVKDVVMDKCSLELYLAYRSCAVESTTTHIPTNAAMEKSFPGFVSVLSLILISNFAEAISLIILASNVALEKSLRLWRRSARGVAFHSLFRPVFSVAVIK